MRRILGIDPGSRKIGIAILDAEGKSMKIVHSDVFDVSSDTSLFIRIKKITELFKEIMLRYAPTEISLEAIIHVRNVSSLSKLAQARGAIISACSQAHPASFHEYSPNLIKQTVSGFGHSDKQSIARATKLIFGDYNIKTFDQSDAVAIALTHLIHFRPKTIAVTANA
jgi:crossover junction endodeoxyribonuclease RuvC